MFAKSKKFSHQMEKDINNIKKYVRAANYLSAAQIYLQGNFLLKQLLRFEDIKPRLLGHWGTCPGINFVYAHLNYLIKNYDVPMLFVLGPGHGYPALQANLFLEGTLGKYDTKAQHTAKGIAYLVKQFSWPYGFPSHSNPETPGVIVEGGELGYALATAYGAVLDNPSLIAACLIGDGEAETGPTATAWHLNKFIDPATNGAVLPILHLNGYKISGPTIFGRMSDRALTSLFTGYGYKVYIVEGNEDVIFERMMQVIEQCYLDIRAIQTRARSTDGNDIPMFPMIILKTLKGWTGIKKLHGLKIEGNCLSHQVTLPNAKSEQNELRALEHWLKSYCFDELFSEQKGFSSAIKNIVPSASYRMGEALSHLTKKEKLKKLVIPSISKFIEDASIPGKMGSSSMRRAGLYLNEVIKRNAIYRNFRIFSPDETYSNKLDAIFESTQRAFIEPIKSWDKDIKHDGRVIEMLSEHSLQAMLQGYVLTGRYGMFVSYEAFIQIISSMVDQYIKFLRIARETAWRNKVPSLNFILTSSGWRQEHNGFSHQNPGFISNILQKYDTFTHVYFPPDGNSMLVVLEKCLNSFAEMNVIVAGKTLEPRWLTEDLARKSLADGLMIWEFASDPKPDIVITGVGDYVSKEALAAIAIIKQETPHIKIRFVNILALSSFGIGNSKDMMVPKIFNHYFTANKPVIFNFHGYPSVLQQLLFTMGDTKRFSIHGYIEQGSTTTPFDMHVRNKTSRWHLAKEVFTLMAKDKVISNATARKLRQKYDAKLSDHSRYIKEYGVDPAEIEQWQWKN